ncbi:MAG: TetR/AcrR family transcriptional regulator C-terminal domain-containing protein [Lachnospiraceae bacterium]|nr:TetR/AcrR family transcriptional regulator C-terminal domain-containing protein [Lachnospiraceae bacterium]
MAGHAKEELSKALLKLSNEMPLEKIGVNDVLKESSISRHTFYASFRDIYDLITYTFINRIIDTSWDMLRTSYDDYYHGMLTSLKKMERHKKFCLEAYILHGQNAPIDYIVQHSIEAESQDLVNLTGKQPEELPLHILRLYAHGCVNTKMHWLKDPQGTTAESVARQITDARFALFAGIINDDAIIHHSKSVGSDLFVAVPFS